MLDRAKISAPINPLTYSDSVTSSEIRNKFLEFFESKGHTRVPSAPIVVKNDPTLMFTNAGMNQFKDWFLGNETPKYKRVVDTQKCLRVSGKHNDLEEVGVDTYHHTMFEMLGNWSFGDYFKTEAIEWAWELLTEVYKLDKNRLYVTYFEGDEKEGLAPDNDALNEWKRWIPEERIIKGNKKDNFWEMGDTGPCGPCSEIHIDLRSEEERKNIDGATLVNNDHPQVIEIWNNVFMEFNRKADGSLEKLPAQHVDTGMGFERLVRAIEGKSSNYDTDVFKGIIAEICKLTEKKYFEGINTDSNGAIDFSNVAIRVIADHIRTICFAINDGQLPSNNGAGYVIRRILRRAVRYYYSYLDCKSPLLYKLVTQVSNSFSDIFPELGKNHAFISEVIQSEEVSFLKTLEIGLNKLYNLYRDIQTVETNFEQSTDKNLSEKEKNNIKQDLEKKYDSTTKSIKAEFLFELYDAFGFPIDLTKVIVSQTQLPIPLTVKIDEAGFEKLLLEQKERSRKATQLETDDWQILIADENIQFLGYDQLEAEIQITRYRKVKSKGKEQFQLVFNQTPFYAESGGQVGDTGSIQSINEKINIVDTQKENNLIIHFADRMPENPAAIFTAKVNAAQRKSTAANHSATHLLHAALRQVLGTHVEQKGSLVNSDYLRFDFSHFKAMTDDEIKQIEHIVNEKIRDNIYLDERRNVPIEEAKKLGAMALFGEKYGDSVRVITFDENYSRELCGGTHVQATGQIGFFKITSESAVAAGVRRIEAISGKKVETLVDEMESTMTELKDLLKAKDLIKSVQQLIDERSELQKKLEVFEGEKTQAIKQELKQKVSTQNGIQVIAEILEIPSAEQLKNLSFQLKNEIPDLFCVLGTVLNDKPLISIIINEDLVKSRQLHAGNIIKEIAKNIQGGGGGQPFYATAGGNNAAGLKDAIAQALTKLN